VGDDHDPRLETVSLAGTPIGLRKIALSRRGLAARPSFRAAGG